MLKYNLIFILIIICNYCFSQTLVIPNKYNKNAVKLNDSAVNIAFKGGRSKESLLLANKLLDSAIKIDPSDQTLYTNKIAYLCHMGKFKDALKQNEILSKVQRDVPEIIEGHGLMLYKLGDRAKAMKDFKHAHQLYENQYLKSHKVGRLINLAFNTYLIVDRASASALINREKYRYKNDLRSKQQLDDFEKYIFPKVNVDNALLL
ncbi:MAG: type IV pilus biogenesis/stability protein PilW [Mucilaginibacter sp.]|uniref:tetratricopeptide repeat protein n=1 Tax=Mucilaginibacter sp. TaxID=1882438 RepID=UPI0034E50042